MNACGVANQYQGRHTHEGGACRVRCPVHGDQDSGNNCALWDEKAGGIGVFCHSRECDTIEIRKKVGILSDSDDAFVKCDINGCKSPTFNRVAVYDHSDGGERCVHRAPCPTFLDGAECKHRGCDGKKNKHIWGPKSPKGTHIKLWGEDSPANTLLFAEGEKCAQALLDYGVQDEGFTPVSWRGGAGKEHLSVYERAAGRFCTLWPDKDSEGQGVTAMHNVALKLEEVGAEMICMIDVSEFEDDFDAAETNSETVLKLIGDPPLYESRTYIERKNLTKKIDLHGAVHRRILDDVFGVKGRLLFHQSTRHEFRWRCRPLTHALPGEPDGFAR